MSLHVCTPPHTRHTVSPCYSSKRRDVGIQDLLVWAYRDEMVHAARPEGVGPGVSIKAGARRALGYGGGFDVEVVDASVNLGFEAAPDAYRVHEAVRSLGPVAVELPADVVGRAGAAVARGQMPDVERKVAIKRSSLVMTCAIDGCAPDWIASPVLSVERGEIVYRRYRGGQIVRDRKGRAVEEMQLVRFVGDTPWAVARARLVYAVWVEALRELSLRLRDEGLERFAVSGVVPGSTPWRT